MKKTLLISLIILFIVGCATPTPQIKSKPNETPIVIESNSNTLNVKSDYLGSGLYRVIDYDAGIVCYNDDTVVCFDIDDTWLSKE